MLRVFPYILFWSLLSLLFACSKANRYDDKEILRFNIAEGVSSLDPAFARTLDNVNATKQLFDGLVDIDENLNVIPSIARRWEIEEEGKLYRFYLRDDVAFHSSQIFSPDSNRKVIASDFIYSLNRLVNKKILSPGKWVMNAIDRKEDGSLNLLAVNDTILEIRLTNPFPPFLGLLSMQYCSVVPHEAFESPTHDFLKHPIGTGAFYFQYWKEGGKLILLKNHNYFQRDEEGVKLPYLDAISISFVKDQEVVFLKFLKGEFDFISGLKGSYKDELLTPTGNLREEYQETVDFFKFPYLNTEYLGFQLDRNSAVNNPPLTLELRKAINFAIDKENMLKYLRNGVGYPANSGFIPRGMPGFDENATYGYSYDLDSASFYLQKYKEKEGIDLNKEKITLGTTAEYLDICEYVQHQLETIGIGVNIEVNQAATANELIAFGKIPFFRKSWIADYPDAENYLSLFQSDNFSPTGPNYTHFTDSIFDKRFKEALGTSNDSARTQLYRELDSLMMSEAPIVPLFYDQQVHFRSPSISNFKVNPMSHLMLKYAKKE